MNRVEKLKIRKGIDLLEATLSEMKLAYDSYIDFLTKANLPNLIKARDKIIESNSTNYEYSQEYRDNRIEINKINTESINNKTKGNMRKALDKNNVAYSHIFFENSTLSDIYSINFKTDNLDKYAKILWIIVHKSYSFNVDIYEYDNERKNIGITYSTNFAFSCSYTDFMNTLSDMISELRLVMKKNGLTIFFSWQSDITINRDIIRSSIRKSIKGTEYQYDESTANEPGAPNIPETIFQKVDDALLFVADITPVGANKKRKLPNPNVMIEVGYALSSIGASNILFIYDESVCKADKLPFDISQRRAISFNSKNEKADEIKKLTDYLKKIVIPKL